MTACSFCRIAAEEPALHVHATERTVSFLDHRPVFEGHVLVVPRVHLVTLDEPDADLLSELFTSVQTIMAAQREALGCQGHFVANNNVVSQSVAHLHVHVVPRTKGDGLRGFFWPRVRYGEGQEAAVRDRLRAAILSEA